MIIKKQFILNIVIVSIASLIGVGTMMAVSADEIDTTSCDGEFMEIYIDADGDGYGDASAEAILACSAPAGYADNNTDCDDDNVDVNPGATEVCDNIDNNCSGENNEDLALFTYYADLDGDGYGWASSTYEWCGLTDGFVLDNTDCNDENASSSPSLNEICGDEIDNNCDGEIDEDCTVATTTEYYLDVDGDGYGDPNSSVSSTTQPDGYVTDNTDCNDYDVDINPGADEICDNIDNNCSGENNEGLSFINYYDDLDDDGYGWASTTYNWCALTDGFVTNDNDCNDDDSDINPDATEICGDGIDNNCDGEIDEDCDDVVVTYYLDADGDGYGDADNSVSTTTKPSGYVFNSTDCDDNDANIYPGATEVCDGVDNNCDGSIDENCEGNDGEHLDCNPFGGEFKNHGEQVNCWAHYTNMLKKQGEITGRGKGQMMKKQNQEKKQNAHQDKNKGNKSTKNKGKKGGNSSKGGKK